MTQHTKLFRKNALCKGNDGAEFDIHTAYIDAFSSGPVCQGCHQEVRVVVKYVPASLIAHLTDLGILKTQTKTPDPSTVIPNTHILKDPDRPLGVTCGCYAKWQRQLVHIRQGMARKEKKHS